MILSIFLIPQPETDSQLLIETSIIFSVLGTMIVQTLISMIALIFSFKAIWKKILKIRAKAFLKNFSKVAPSENPTIHDTSVDDGPVRSKIGS